jgi:hypothetical protein
MSMNNVIAFMIWLLTLLMVVLMVESCGGDGEKCSTNDFCCTRLCDTTGTKTCIGDF